jgi:predicted kinase
MWTLGQENNFYKSKHWKDLIFQLRLDRVNPTDGMLYCAHCGKPILKKYDCIGHHVIELTNENVNDTSISLNPDNIILIHFRCHNEIHQRFGYSGKNVFIVYGAPCSGKSTFVRANATRNDLICDIDKIYECLTVLPSYDKQTTVKGNVFDVRDFILDLIRMRKGQWNNAYIIGGYPLKGQRERLATQLNAKLIHIDTSIEDCLARAEARPKEWIEYINDYFEDFQE